ncbi:molybdenum cofactor biosynthesis protein MoaE [Sphingosinicella rhizophila]|uniref:Molybdopterin synthase catalytic subunit n=1 Tax=Sphingosinicella rhizophila TaxID=3050082 RepID=A0ABU3Q4T2_9SPHN|nr:molybdenum cofactor biosynthesis protein MoaE [Sphingosinicella sp. GR2756]MDT9598417.1 molybdenum cofactor biosynthesis protein MoaE [Sphingosinicella sp. GR2756]
MIDIRIQAGDFDPGRQLGRLEELGRAAVSGFVAMVEAAEDVTEILVEHHPVLAKNALRRIAEETERNWPLAGIILIHRHGRLRRGERLAFAAVAASDPRHALDGCCFLVDALRSRALFWRKELAADGSGRWMEP